MILISSKAKTTFNKRINPILWFGFLLFFLSIIVYGRMWEESLILVVLPVVMMVVGVYWRKTAIFPIVDRVFDCGDHLLVEKGELSVKVNFSEIVYVDEHLLSSPHTVTLKLRKPNQIGSEIVFCPSFDSNLNPFKEGGVAKSLSKRANAWRRSG